MRGLVLIIRGRGRRYWCCAKRPTARFVSRSFQLLILHDDELVLADLVAPTFTAGFHHFARDGVDELLAQPVASFSIDLPE